MYAKRSKIKFKRFGTKCYKIQIMQKVFKSLKEKDCLCLKSNKGNKLTVLDKSDYYEPVDNLLANERYSHKIIRNKEKNILLLKNLILNCRFFILV